MINLFSIHKFFADAFTFSMGPSGGASSTTTTSNVPEYMKQNYKDLYDIATQQVFQTDAEGNITGFKPYVGYSANPADYVAGFSPMQEQSFKGAANLSVPGQFGQATDLAGAAGMGGINSAQQAYNYGAQGSQYGNLGAQYGAQGAGYGDIAAQIGQMGLQAQATGEGITQQSQDLAAQQAAAGDIYQQLATNPNAVQAYMSPYQQAVTQQAIDSAYRNAAIQKTGRQATAAKAGAFGGSRQAIENAEADRALNTQLQAIQATGDQAAYDKAIQSMQYGTTLGMQGLGGAQSGLGTALQGGQLGLSGIGTALQGLQGGMQGAGVGISGAQAGMQGAGVGLQGVAGAQSGYGVANQAGSNLANIGTQQNAAAQSILDQQNQFGGQQQANQQQVINNAIGEYGKAQGWGQDQISYLNALLHGTPSLGTTRTTYAGTADPLSSVIGAGTVAAGVASRKEGGIIKLAQGGAIKGYAGGGGIMGRDNVERIAENLSIPQLQQSMQNQTVPEYVGIPLLQMKTQEAQRAQQAQMMQAQQGQQGGQAPSIKEQILAQAQGIDSAASNLPTAYGAEGGIVAFGQGGDVPGYFKGGLPETEEEFNSLPPEEQQRLRDRMGLAEGFKKTGAAAMDLATLPGRAIMGAAETGISRPLRAMGVPIPYLPESAYGGDRSSMTPFYDKYVRGQESQTKPKGSAQNKLNGPYAPNMDPEAMAYKQAEVLKNRFAPQGNEGLGGSSEAKARAGAGAGGAGNARGAGGAPEWKDFTPTKLDETLYDERLKDKPTFESASEEMKKRRKEYGIDDELYTKQRADIAKEKDDVTKRLKEADSDSMIMAGLRMLSGTPISEAALTEFKQNALTKKDLKAEERVLRKENNDIDRAEQARNEARLSGDTARFDKYDTEYKALVDKKQSRVDQNVSAVNAAALNNKTLQFNKDLKVWEVNTEQAGLSARAETMAGGQNKYYNALAKQLGFSNAVKDKRSEYVDKNLLPVYKSILNNPDPSKLTGKNLVNYNKALAAKKALEKEADTKFRNLPGMDSAAVQPPTGRVKFLGFENP